MLKDVNIKKKLIGSFVIILILASISGIVSIFVTANMNKQFNFAINNYGFAQGDVGKLLACLGSVNVSVHDVIGYVDQDAQASAQQMYQTQVQKMEDYFNNVESTMIAEDTRAFFQAAKTAWENYKPLAEKLMVEGDTDNAAIIQKVQKQLVSELDPIYQDIYNNMANVLFNKVDDGNELQAELTASINSSTIFIMIMILAALIISMVLATKIANSIANPIHACAKRLRDLAHGDLKSPVPDFSGKDEIGTLASATQEIVSGLIEIIEDEEYLLSEMSNGNFNIYSKARDKYVGDFMAVLTSIRKINFRLSDTLHQINRSSDQVSSGSDQVSVAAQNLSQGAAEQAGSIETLAATITEISEQIASNAEHAANASEKAHHVGLEMEKSNEKMQNMIDAMGEINNSSKEIGKIIKTIEDIAFQTNILALNAAVEAARAGAAGKGFAVVADEVRNLASKSAEASKNTAQLIESSIHAVDNGTQIADDTAKALRATVTGVEEVVEIVTKISTASAQQSKSVEQVTVNVDQISSVVQTNSATAEESAAASEELSSQATILRELVNKFQLKSEEETRGGLLQ